MAGLVVRAAAAVVGFYVGGPAGAAWGWTLGGVAYDATRKPPTQYNIQPPAPDNGIPQSDFGTPLPWAQGCVQITGVLVWQSARRENVTRSESGGGKGGTPTTVNESRRYERDFYFVLADGENYVTRIWEQGVLIWTCLATATEASLLASAATPAWRRMTVYTGDDAQTADPTYEAAILAAYPELEAGDVPAYVGVTSVFMEGVDLGPSSRQMFWTFEVCSKGTVGEVTFDANVLVQSRFTDGSAEDESIYGAGGLVGSELDLVGDQLVSNNLGIGTGLNPVSVIYGGTHLGYQQATGWALQFRTTVTSLAAFFVHPVFQYADSNLTGSYGKIFGIYEQIATVWNLSIYQGSIGTFIGRFPIPLGITPFHVELDATAPTGGPSSEQTLYVYLDGALQFSATITEVPDDAAGIDWILVLSGGATNVGAAKNISYDYVQLYKGPLHSGESFTPPEDLPDVDQASAVTTILPIAEDLPDVVERAYLRAGFQAGQYEVDPLDTITRKVRGLKVLPGPMRPTLEQLGSMFFFELVLTDKISEAVRGEAAVATIAYAELGAYEANSTPAEPFEKTFGADVEVPAAPALTYPNASQDYETDTQVDDRQLTLVQTTNAIQSPLVLIPSEAKAIVETWAMDLKVASFTTKFSLRWKYSYIVPGDAVILTDADGSTFRFRVVKRHDTFPRINFDAVFDDASILVQQGITSTDYTASTNVNPLADTVAVELDIPILQDSDSDAGRYKVAMGEAGGGDWPGAEAVKSPDDVEYTHEASFDEAGVIGACVTTLGDWTGPFMFDEGSSLRVTVPEGTIASSTRDALIGSKSVNACAVGVHGRWEIAQYRKVTLISTVDGVSTCDLTGWLRGQRGTEWAMTGHGSGETFVLLRPEGLRRIVSTNSEIGTPRYVKTVTYGKLLDDVAGELFTHYAVGLKPFSPVDFRVSRDGSNDATLSIRGRSRFSCREFSDFGVSIPPDEITTLFRWKIYDDDTYTTQVDELESSIESVAYSAAAQTAASLTPGDPIYARVTKVSPIVGEGYALEAAA